MEAMTEMGLLMEDESKKMNECLSSFVTLV